MHYELRSTVSIELLDQGMIVSYREPVKRTRMVGGARVDPMTQALVSMLPQILENLPGSEGEAWNERKESRKNLVKDGIEKAMESLKPKAVEEWVWSMKRIVVSDNQALLVVLGAAKESASKAEAIVQDGTVIHDGYYRGAVGVGDYIAHAAYPADPERPSFPSSFSDIAPESL
jgi:hypothetical protein